MPLRSLIGLYCAPYLALGVERSRADDANSYSWPGWRGPGRDAQVDRSAVPSSWPDELREDWRVEVGSGYGTPVVSGGRVYVHVRQGDEEVAMCLDLASGEVLWRQGYPVYFKAGMGGEKHGTGPKASPVVDGGRLFTFGITGAVTAWDGESGEQLWRRDFADRFKKNYPYWGTASSPLVEGGLVVVQIGDDEDGALCALRAGDGEIVWSHGGAPTSYSSPIVVEIGGVRQIVQWNAAGLIGLEPADGRLLWEFAFPQRGNDQNTPTPVFDAGRFYVGGENRGMRCVGVTREGDRWSAREVWHQEEIALDMSSAVMHDGELFGFSHHGRGQLFQLDPASGEVTWKGPRRFAENVMFLALPDHVVALLDVGELLVLKPDGAAPKTLQRYRVAEDDSTWAPPVLVPRAVLIKDKNHLTRWSF